MYKELADKLREHAQWAAANEWETPITLGDDLSDAAEAIDILQSELERVTRERDAAVEDLRKFGQCGACKNHYREEPCGADLYSYCDGGFTWRGVTNLNFTKQKKMKSKHGTGGLGMEIKMNLRMRSRKVNMALDDIKIPLWMAMTPPKPGKQIRHSERYFLSGGKDYDPIIIDENNTLIDGYTTYLIFEQQEIKRVTAYRIAVKLDLEC